MNKAAARTAMMTASGLERVVLPALGGAPVELGVDELEPELVLLRRLVVEVPRVVVVVLPDEVVAALVVSVVVDAALVEEAEVGAEEVLADELLTLATTFDWRTNRSE